MADSTFSVSSVSSVKSRESLNPILQLRKLQESIKSAPALSRNDRATRTRLLAERSGIREQSSLFSSLRTEIKKLNSLAGGLDVSKLIKRTDDDAVAPSVTSSSSSVSAFLARTASTSGTFSIGVSQLASAASLTGAAIESIGEDAGFGEFTVKHLKKEGGVSFIQLDEAAESLSDGGSVTINGTLSGATSANGDPVTDTLFVRAKNAANKEFELFTDEELTNAVSFDKVNNVEDLSITVGTRPVEAGLTTTLGELDNLSSFGLSINGVSNFNFSSSTAIGDVLNAINGSKANVTATFDSDSRSIAIQANSTGAGDISVSGDLAARLGLSGDDVAKTSGTDAVFTVDGEQFTSSTNSIDGKDTGISAIGLTLNSVTETDNPITLTVTAGTLPKTVVVTDDIVAFFEQFNKVQSFIEANVEKGGDAFRSIESGLRQSVSSVFGSSAFSGAITATTGSSQLTIDKDALASGIKGNIAEVLDLFSGEGGSGFAAKTSRFLSGLTGSSGVLAGKVSALQSSESSITRDLDALAAKEENNRTRLNDSLAAASQALVAIQNQKGFVNGLGGQSQTTQTREGTTGLNLSGQLDQIRARFNEVTGNSSEPEFDPTNIEQFLQDLLNS